jgi:hypothetical protein
LGLTSDRPRKSTPSSRWVASSPSRVFRLPGERRGNALSRRRGRRRVARFCRAMVEPSLRPPWSEPAISIRLRSRASLLSRLARAAIVHRERGSAKRWEGCATGAFHVGALALRINSAGVRHQAQWQLVPEDSISEAQFSGSRHDECDGEQTGPERSPPVCGSPGKTFPIFPNFPNARRRQSFRPGRESAMAGLLA